MQILKTREEIRETIRFLKSQGCRIGLVPTMGFLHEGHMSLVRRSLGQTDKTVVSIFVNPAQFGPREDFKDYPRDLERDCELLRKEGVDIVFAPSVEDIYPADHATYVEVVGFQDKLCGKTRPGHFRGVCTIVSKLFHLVDPDRAFFGQKDAQQAVILQKMARELDCDVEIEVCPIVREADGLAMSSRNIYLNPEQRRAALCLRRSLLAAEDLIARGESDAGRIRAEMRRIIQNEKAARIDYIAVVDFSTLEPLSSLDALPVLIALAVHIGHVRLIDNTIVYPKEIIK